MAATRRKHRLAAGILFLVYFVVLFYFLFFSEKMGRTYSERAYHYNLVPLKEIARFVKYWRVLGMKAVLLNILGNVAAFLPFGFFLPVFSGRLRPISPVCALLSSEKSERKRKWRDDIETDTDLQRRHTQRGVWQHFFCRLFPSGYWWRRWSVLLTAAGTAACIWEVRE